MINTLRNKILKKTTLIRYKKLRKEQERNLNNLKNMEILCKQAKGLLGSTLNDIKNAIERGKMCLLRMDQLIRSLENNDYKYIEAQAKFAQKEAAEFNKINQIINNSINDTLIRYKLAQDI